MAGLGRTVLARQRMARLWGLGDRINPISKLPGLVITDDEFDVSIAPFKTTSDGGIPRRVQLISRAPFAPWESTDNGPTLSASIGLVLPPSLDEADAGEVASKGDMISISWQSLNHDPELLDPNLKPHVVILSDALQLANRPGRLVQAIHVIKNRFPGSLLWTPGLGGPDNCAVLAWFGVDLFDTTRTAQAQAHGAVLTWNGPRPANANEVANSHWESAIAEVHSAISRNRLRELAQSQSMNSPRLVEHLRRHDQIIHSSEGVLSQVVPRGTALRIHSSEGHHDPVIVDWIDFITNDYTKPNGLDEVLILLPCSARKPYSSSQSHKSFRRAINHSSAHEVIVTSPLGLVPRDLEEVWPAGHYDIPVTGDWTKDEESRVRDMLDSLISRNNYRVIINHSGLQYDSDVRVIDTRQGLSATNYEALDRLNKAVDENIQVRKRSGEMINLGNFKSVARFHHLNDDWLNGVQVRGRFPRWKILKDGEQIAMWSPERGSFSVSKACIPLMDSCNSLKRIYLKEDVKWKGDVNLVNLESYNNSIRAGEDILVMQGSQCVGSARASAPAWEWSATPGRLAKMHQRL